MPIGDLVTRATAQTRTAVADCLDADWSVPAGDLEWTCRYTGVHLADDLFSYASQILAQPTSGYLPIEVVVEDTASPADLVRSIEMCGGLLRLAALNADPGARGWHPFGTSDADGFAAMGIVETLVHTYDIASGLGVSWRPPADLCVPVLDRLFPEAPQGEPSEVLLWCTGRAALGAQSRLTSWQWDSTVRP